MAEIVKRARAANFSMEEKRLCLELVAKYSGIVENKRTDSSTKAMKDNAWTKICAQFNAVCPNQVHRTPKHLKHFYENQKRIAKKQLAAECSISFRRTGDKIPVEDPLLDITLSIIKKKTVFGLPTVFDDDASGVPTKSETSDQLNTSIENVSGEEEMIEEVEVTENPLVNFEPTTCSSSSPSTPFEQAEKQNLLTNEAKGKEQLEKELMLAQIARAKAEQEYWQEKNKREEEKFQLEKKILLRQLSTRNK